LIRKRFAELGLEASEFSQSQKQQRSGYDRAPAGPEKPIRLGGSTSAQPNFAKYNKVP
jgi:hypothetical protein